MPPLRPTGAALAAALLVLVSGLTARAQTTPSLAPPLTPEQTESLAHALSIYGKPARERTFGAGTNRIVPEADGYRVSVPIYADQPHSRVAVDDMTMRARLDGQRWSFDELRLPRIAVIAPLRGSTPAATVTLDTKGLDYRATIDPSHASEGTVSATADGGRMVVDTADSTTGKLVRFVLEGGRFDERQTAGVATNGRLDQASTMALDNLKITIEGAPGTFTVGQVGVGIRLGQYSPDRLEDLEGIAEAADAANDTARKTPTLDGSSGRPTLTPAQRDALFRMLDGFSETLKSLEMTQDWSDVALTDPVAGRIRLGKLSLATKLAAVDGKLDARQAIELRDFSMAPDKVPPAFAALVPHRVTAIAHLGGASTGALAATLKRALDTPDAARGMLLKLLADSPVHAAIDALSFDLGPASFDMTAAVDVRDFGLADANYAGDIKVTGVAALQAVLAASTDPRLSEDGVRALLFAKGLGKPDGDAVLWHVEMRHRRVFVNGTDMQTLLPR